MSHSSVVVGRLPSGRRAASYRADPLSLADEPIPGARVAAQVHTLHWLPAVIALALFAAVRLDLLPPIPW